MRSFWKDSRLTGLLLFSFLVVAAGRLPCYAAGYAEDLHDCCRPAELQSLEMGPCCDEFVAPTGSDLDFEPPDQVVSILQAPARIRVPQTFRAVEVQSRPPPRKAPPTSPLSSRAPPTEAVLTLSV